MFQNPFYISFPNLGIAPFEVDRVAFSLFGRDVAWYGVIICVGMLLAFWYGTHATKREGISSDDFFNILLFAIPFGIIGARLFHVLVSLDYYIGRPFVEWIAIWNGGGAIYGSIIAGILVIAVYSRVRRLNVLKVLDAFVPSLLIGQCIGRWGNFVNGEAYGSVTDVPWAMGLGNTAEVASLNLHHPTFLYESLWTLSMFLVIHFLLSKKKKYNGEIFFFYVAFYGIGRFLVEQFRIDESIEVFGVRIAALIGVCCFVLFGSLFVLGFVKAKKGAKISEAAEVPEAEAAVEEQEGAAVEAEGTPTLDEKTAEENNKETENGNDAS